MANSDQHIAVALSGGGHRASLFGLGAMLYLVDAAKGSELATVSSISGGSLTNAHLGLSFDLTTATPADVWRDTKPFAGQIASRGTVWASRLTIAYLVLLFAVLAAPLVLSFLLPAPWSLACWAVGLVIAGLLAQRRSWIATRSFDAKLFRGRTLEHLHGAVSHVVCATDLQTSEAVYFSDRFVHSWRLGWGQPAGLPIAVAVQASAALPGAFNVVSLPTSRHGFSSSELPRFKLTDGGVYDNMGTEWPIRLRRRLTEGTPPTPPLKPADELILVNASAAKDVIQRRSVRTPLLGELTTLLAVKDVLYDQTTAVRRRLVDLRFRATRGGVRVPDGDLAGVLVQIDRSPFELPDSFRHGTDELAGRANAAIEVLGEGTRQAWAADASASKHVKTALSKIPVERAAALVRHAYVLTMVNCHVVLGYPLRTVPSDDAFRDLVT